MDIIRNNPYRIAGVLSNANARELQRQKAKINAYANVGKDIVLDVDFPIFSSISRTESNLERAFSAIEQNRDKVKYSLFWFLNSNPFDETAINYLINGDKEKALEIWGKVTYGREVTAKNFSSFNNIGTLQLISRFNDDIKAGIESKIKLIESDNFENFVHSVADETFSIDTARQIELLVDELLKQFQNKYSTSEAMELFSNCNGTTQKYLSKKFTEEPTHKVEIQIESCKKKRKGNKSGAYEFGLKLFTNTEGDLSLLKSLLGISNLKYKAIADQLANEVMQCGIDYFNECQENDASDNYLESAQKLTKLADSIAVGQLTKDRAKDSLLSLEEMKDREVSQAVELLQSVRDAYETNEINIRREVENLKRNDLQIKMGYKSINEFAVDDNIKNSIDWTKVNDLLKEILSDERLAKIKSSPNNKLKADFIELVYWLKKYSQSNSVVEGIVDKYKKIPPSLSFKILSSEVTNTDNKPLYTKFIRHIGLNLNIEVICDTSVVIYLKYVNPNGSIKRNLKNSPNGYTLSVTKMLTKESRSINIPGWGNAGECSYAIGEHRIEVYIDEYLMHTKKYTVDLAPSEKIGKEIENAESKLKEISQMDYSASEIKFARDGMIEIQKFKLFRGSSEKQRQIEAQQSKINKLIERSEVEKSKDIENQKAKVERLKLELLEVIY